MSRRGAIVRLDEAGFPYILVNTGASTTGGKDRGVIRQAQPEEGGEPLSPALTVCEFLKEHQVEWVALELPVSRTVVHMLELPAMKMSDARKALPFEFERKLPVPLDNFFWSYTFIQAGRNGYQAFASGVPKTLLSPFLEALRSAEIEIKSVELAAFRFHGRQETGKDVLSLGTGEDTVDLVTVKDGRPLEVKAVDLPPDPEIRLQVMVRTLEREIEGTGIRNIWMYGNIAQEVRTALTTLEGVRIHVAETIPRVGGKTPRGLYMLDVLPGEYRKKRNPHNLILGVLMVLLVLAFYFQITVKSRIDEQALANVRDELSTLRQSVDTVSGPLKEREQVFRSLRLLRPFFSESNRPFVALRELSRLLPRDTWLVNFDMDEKGKIEIDGYSTRSSELLALLDESPRFTGVEMAGPVIVQPMGEHFSIRMYWEQ